MSCNTTACKETPIGATPEGECSPCPEQPLATTELLASLASRLCAVEAKQGNFQTMLSRFKQGEQTTKANIAKFASTLAGYYRTVVTPASQTSGLKFYPKDAAQLIYYGHGTIGTFNVDDYDPPASDAGGLFILLDLSSELAGSGGFIITVKVNGSPVHNLHSGTAAGGANTIRSTLPFKVTPGGVFTIESNTVAGSGVSVNTAGNILGFYAR